MYTNLFKQVYWSNLIRLASVILFCFSITAQAQDISVSGKVTDEFGDGLPGVNVLIKGTTTGTVSDAEGNYRLSVPGDATLVFSYVGYMAQEVAVNNQSTINVGMDSDLQALEEIVVVGYGQQKRSDVTGSIVSVDEKAIKEIPAADVANAIQGRVAGVNIQRTGSRPGAGTEIRIRGNRSLPSRANDGNPPNNNPLLVVDGIPFNGNLNDINPNDIQSVDILKDASATAIYGSRGSNGVIIITTRRGRTGKAQLTYNGYHGVSSAIGKYDLFNGQEYADFVAASGFKDLTAIEQESLANGRETDWQEEMYETGFITNHEIGVSGGTDDTQYKISGGYFKDKAVVPGQSFSRFNMRAVLDQKIGEKIRIGLNTYNSFSEREGENASFMFNLLTLSPLYRAYEDNGDIFELPAVGSLDSPTKNPLLVTRENTWQQRRRRFRSFNSLFGEVSITDALKYRINVGLDFTQEKFGDYRGVGSAFINDGGTSTGRLDNDDVWSYTIENIVTYNKTFNEKHNFGFTGLFSVQEEETHGFQANANDVPADYLLYYDLGLANGAPTVDGNYARWGLMSFMGRINYGYDDRFLVTLTARRDGSSRLAEGNEWFTYPAAAFAWNLHNEDFLSGSNLISNLKLRAGIGKTSNQAISPYSSLGGLGQIRYNYGGSNQIGYYFNSLTNQNLTWESTTTTNLGIDVGLITNRVTLSIDLYQQKTKDILQSRALPIMSGVTNAIVENVGKTEGRGIEIMVNSVNVESASGDGFGWNTNFNFSLHRDEIVQLFDTISGIEGEAWFVGESIDVLYDYEKIGIWQLGEEDEADAFGGYQPGDVRVADLNNNGVRDPDDRKVLGRLTPDFEMGMTNRFSYGPFDLSVVMYLRYGGKLVSTLYQANQSEPLNSLEGRRNGPDVDYWTPTNPTNEFPRTGDQQPDFGSTLGYFDATYMKIRNINLGYTFPQTLLDRLGLNSARVYLSANQPFKAFFSDYVKMGGVDPEPTGRGTSGNITPGLGQRLTVRPDTPPARQIIFGVNIGL